MTRKTRILISLVLVVVAFVAGITVFAQSNKDRSAQADGTSTTRYTVDEDGKIELPPLDSTKAKGTEENPFFILELVPYEELGTFGYQIAGCEPVDMQKVAFDNTKQIPPINDLYTSSTRTEHRWVSEGLPDYFPASTETANHLTQYGTMKYVGDGTGNYNRKTDPAPTYSYEAAPAGYTGTRYVQNADSSYTEDSAGTFMRHTVSAQYEETTGGDYLWTPLPANDCQVLTEEEKAAYTNSYHDPDENGEFKMYFNNVPCYIVYSVKDLQHKNYFLKESIGLAYEMRNGVRVDYVPEAGEPTLEERIANYKCVVYTVTPEDLNIMKDGVLVNQELIDRADLMSISSVAAGDYVTAYEHFKEYDSYGLMRKLNRKTTEGGTETTFADNPLDWPAALAIYERAASATNPLPIIWDTHTYAEISSVTKEVELKCSTPNGNLNTTVEGSQDNLFKLYLMLYDMSTTTFESFFGDPASFATATYTRTYDLGATELTREYKTPLMPGYEGEGNRYWTFLTLCPWKSGILPKPSEPLGADNAAVLDTFGIMSLANGAIFHYVDGDAQNAVRNGIHIYDGGNFLKTAFASSPSGVQNNQYGREVYEFFDSIGVPKSSVTTAEVLYYLLNGLEDGPGAVNNADYKVLELQPATNYKSGTDGWTPTTDAFWRAFIATYANTTGTVTVDRMSTSEFIGKKAELVSEYDLIYMGVNTLSGNWTMDYEGGTDFVYAHTGPTVEVTTENGLRGWLTTNTNKYVLSGNDLTNAKRTDLKEYVASGAPLLFGTGFFTDENATASVGAIDRNSNVYKLAEVDITTPLYEYALTKSSTRLATENALRAALKKERRVELKNVTEPRPYVEGATNPYLTGNQLEFKFTVAAPAGTKYEVVLYVDINGDGVFTLNERIDGLNIQKSTGETVTNRLVQAGGTYTVKRAVTDRKGAVAWKLDLVENNPSKDLDKRMVYASLDGLSAIKATEKEPLRILQIVMPNRPDGSNPNNLLLPQAGENPTVNSVPWKFKEWTKDINGLEISFIRKTESEIKNQLATNSNYLQDNYEMVVLGFGDMYDGVKEESVINAIQAYVASGRAVLYTHDTSSMIGEGGSSWGKEVTKAFRDRFGMDRYDVVSHKGAESGVDRADYPYRPSSSSSDGVMIKDGAQVLAQGITNGHLYRYKKNSGSNVSTTKVSQVNTGAITEYPYKIDPTLTVAETHPQYYQLDMEQDIINVWYCLSNSSNVTSSIGKYFNATSQDVRNNYYIYNYGNITYSGMGHSNNLSDEEIQLFINTFVAAYRAAATPVQVIAMNDDATKNVTDGTYYVCVDLDSKDADQLLGGVEQGVHPDYDVQVADGSGYKIPDDGSSPVTGVSKRVYFKIDNTSTSGEVTGYDLKISTDSSGTMTEMPLAIYRTNKVGEDSVVQFMDRKSASTKFNSDDIYFMDVPVKYEIKNATEKAVTTTQVDVEVTMYYKIGEDQFHIPGTTTIYITPRGLFDLD